CSPVVRDGSWNSKDLSALCLTSHDQENVTWIKLERFRKFAFIDFAFRRIKSKATRIFVIANSDHNRTDTIVWSEQLTFEGPPMGNFCYVTKFRRGPLRTHCEAFLLSGPISRRSVSTPERSYRIP